MLHLNTIDEPTHKLLVSLFDKEYLNDFYLVGGTSLSLRYGHRKSIDIDLFSPKEFNPSTLEELIKTDYPEYVYRGSNRYMLFCNIGPVKLDIVYHPFDLIAPAQTIDNIKMFSVEDVAAMKLFAICKRGTRKDFYDVWTLLQHFSSAQLASFFIHKYGEEKLIFLRKSIVYFEDAEESEQPEIILKTLIWEEVKKAIYVAFIDL